MSAGANPTRLVWRRLVRHRLAELSLVFLAVLLVLCARGAADRRSCAASIRP